MKRKSNANVYICEFDMQINSVFEHYQVLV